MKCLALVPLVLASALAGCVGTLTPVDNEGGDDVGGPDGGVAGGVARTQFTTSVQPLLNAACASCHVAGSTGPNFLGSTGTPGYYAAVVADVSLTGNFNPATAQLLLKGAHDGRAWLDNEKTTITSWLNAEAAER